MVKCIIFSYFLIPLSYMCTCLIFSEKTNFSETNSLNNCLKNVIEFQVVPHDKDITLVNATDSLAKTVYSIQKVSFNSRKYFAINNTHYNKMYVLIAEDFKELAEGFTLIKKDTYWNPKAKFVIVVENLNEDILNISNVILFHNVYNVTVIAKDNYGEYTIHNFGPHYDLCKRPAKKALQPVCRCSELVQNTTIFNTMNLSSVRGCRQRLITHNYYPFIQIRNTTTCDTLGIERYIINIVQEIEGVVVSLIDYKQDEHFGNVYPNYTHTEMLQEIETKNVDGAVGGYFITANRANSLSFLYPYVIDHYRIIVRRARFLDIWQAVLAHFSILIVFLILLMFSIFCLATIQLSIFKTRNNDTIRDILVVYGYLLNNVISKHMKSGIPHRVIVLNMSIFAILLTGIIQASLMAVTTHPLRYYQVKNVEEITETHQFIVSSGTRDSMIELPVMDMSRVQILCNVTRQCIEMVKDSDNKLFTIASNIYHDYLIPSMTDDKDDSGLYKTGDAIGIILQTMLFSRGSTVLDAFEKVIMRARECGLISYYFSEIEYTQRLKYAFHREKKPYSKQLLLLKQAYIILMLGYTLSILVFIYECKSKKTRK